MDVIRQQYACCFNLSDVNKIEAELLAFRAANRGLQSQLLIDAKPSSYVVAKRGFIEEYYGVSSKIRNLEGQKVGSQGKNFKIQQYYVGLSHCN